MNDITVGASLLLVGIGFFSTRFNDIMAFRVANVPETVPMIGGGEVTVGRLLALIPLTMGAAVLLNRVKGFTKNIPIVSQVTNVAGQVIDVIAEPAEAALDAGEMEAAEAETVDQINPTQVESEEDVSESYEAETKTSKSKGTPKQQAWRSCVAKSGGDMAKAKAAYKKMGY